MLNFSFQLSKRTVLILGFVGIFLLFLLNRYNSWKKSDKVEGIYIELTSTNQQTNMVFLLDFFNRDTVYVKKILSKVNSPYLLVYKYSKKNNFKELDYTLTLESGSNVLVLINKKHKEKVSVYTFIVFWIPFIIISLFFPIIGY